MKASELLAKLPGLVAEKLEQGYDPATALRFARELLTDEALFEATGPGGLDAHEYWNTDNDYFIDFWKMPRSIVMQRLNAAAAEIKEAFGITVHLCECA